MATNTRDLYPTITKRKNEESTTETPSTTSKTETTTTPTKTETSSSTKLPEFKDFEYDKFSYKDYEESDVVKQAQAMLNEQLANKPGAYQSQWQTQLNDVINKIMNREKFSYDVNGDALYQQYKDQYVTQGQMAMQDAMGQAAAMTGGYGNSYAQSVGQQTYQGYLQQLTDKVPELYQLALSKYNQEGQDMLNQYALLGDQENLDYGRYRDNVSDYYTNLDYLTNRYDTERNLDYSKWADDRNFQYGKYSDEKNYAYTDYRNTIADQQWQTEFDESVRQFNKSLQYKQEAAKKEEEEDEVDMDVVNAFKANLVPESQHDAIARQMYGSYSDYKEKMIKAAWEKGEIGDAEAEYLLKTLI